MATPDDRTLAALVEMHPELGSLDALVPLAEGFGARLAGVLDWENAAFDDPAQDYATLLHSGYPVADGVLAIACEISGQDPEPLRRRRAWHWGYREFSGLAMSIVAGDDAEADESLAKLRNGALRHTFDPE
jgi:hypothetical protein